MKRAMRWHDFGSGCEAHCSQYREYWQRERQSHGPKLVPARRVAAKTGTDFVGRFDHIRDMLCTVLRVSANFGSNAHVFHYVRGSKCLPNLSFPSFCFDREAQKYYHARLMSAQAVIDSLEFARSEKELRGSLPVSGLTRLQDFLYDNVGSVDFVVKGGFDNEMRPVLSLTVSGQIHLQCQRCLDRMDYPLRLSNTLLLVSRGENQAEVVVDPDAPDSVEASTAMDVAGLIEDEILLGLPFSPRHEAGACDYRPKDATLHTDQPGGLAGLAELKRVWKSKR